MLRDLFSLFPAYAGVILAQKIADLTDATFPRIRGGDPFMGALYNSDRDFSPHTRG